MRANLISLQNIATETATTQQHLATGKKVNSALDNPTEFFASQNMMSQASSLSDLADGMSNGIQMIQSANTGITGIQGLLASAKSVSQSAIGNTGAVNTMNSASVTLSSILAGDNITVDGVTFTASNTMADQTAAGKFYIGAAGSENDNMAAANLAAAINNTGLNTAGAKDIQATSVTGSTINLASEAATPVNILNTDVAWGASGSAGPTGTITLNGVVDGDIIQVNNEGMPAFNWYTATSTDPTAIANGFNAATGLFYIGPAGSENMTTAAANLAALMAATTSTPADMVASAKDIVAVSHAGNQISIASGNGSNFTGADIAGSGSFTANVQAGALGPAVSGGTISINPANDTLSQLMAQYTGIMNQIDKEAADSGFQGINLLGGTNPNAVTINFGSSTGDGLALAGIDASSTGLGTNLITANWGTDANVNTDIAKIDAATTTLNNYSSNLSSNLSIITDRQTFSTSMENVLQTGSSNLVNADTNQEGANMLMLQTQQSLGTTALSLASQSAQSVLKLFG
jgi:flagellin-like hook-associated protein FlgL